MKLLLPRRKGRLLPVQTTSWIFSRNCVKDDSKSLLLPLKKIKPKIPPTEKQRFSRILQKTHSDTEAAENDIAQTRPDLTRIFTFSSLDTVIRAALALNGWYTGTNTLYKDRETTYVLILHQSGMNPEDFNRVCNMLSEYGTGKACTAATEAYFKEHGEILIADQALQQLLLLHV